MVFGVTKNADFQTIEFMISYNEEKSGNEKCVPLYPKWVQTFFPNSDAQAFCDSITIFTTRSGDSHSRQDS